MRRGLALVVCTFGCRSDQAVAAWPTADWDDCTVQDDHAIPFQDPRSLGGANLLALSASDGTTTLVAVGGGGAIGDDIIVQLLFDRPSFYPLAADAWWSGAAGPSGMHLGVFYSRVSAARQTVCADGSVCPGRFVVSREELGDSSTYVVEPGSGADTPILPYSRHVAQGSRWAALKLDFDPASPDVYQEGLAVYDLSGQLVQYFSAADVDPEYAFSGYDSVVADLDGDGFEELVLDRVGKAREYDESGRPHGLAVFRGVQAGLDVPPLLLSGDDLPEGAAAEDSRRMFVLSTALLDGPDEPPALLVGAPFDAGWQAGSGSVCALRFGRDAAAPSGLAVMSGPDCMDSPLAEIGSDAFGAAFAFGDLLPERVGAEVGYELAVGAPRADDDDGAVLLVSIADGQLRPDIGLARFDAKRPRERFGASLALGDAGLVVGAPGDGAALAGRLYASGCTR